MVRRWLHDERGATAIEYALIASLVCIAAAAAMSLMGGGTNGLWGKVGAAVNKALS